MASFLRKLQYPIILKMLETAQSDKILDVGCGGGELAVMVSNECTYIGVDSLFNAVKNKHALKNTILINAHAERLPFKDEYFDKIVVSSVLQMVSDDMKVLLECRRVLKRKGKLVLSVPLDYCVIKKLYFYSKNQIINKFLRIIGLPENYENLKKEFIVKFGAKGQGFYTKDEVKRKLCQADFIVSYTEYSPKRLGTFIYELMLIVCRVFRMPLFHSYYNTFMYPFIYLDRYLSSHSKGCEIIICARAH
ncbi:MAG: methyltransferase domain-containing protein [Elusimicrobia bacterium]|nr:methyltransferase domain-containing protein [Elusimicrobiota bacterium]